MISTQSLICGLWGGAGGSAGITFYSILSGTHLSISAILAGAVGGFLGGFISEIRKNRNKNLPKE